MKINKYEVLSDIKRLLCILRNEYNDGTGRENRAIGEDIENLLSILRKSIAKLEGDDCITHGKEIIITISPCKNKMEHCDTILTIDEFYDDCDDEIIDKIINEIKNNFDLDNFLRTIIKRNENSIFIKSIQLAEVHDKVEYIDDDEII